MRPPKKKVLPTSDEVENIESTQVENTETTGLPDENKNQSEEKRKFSLQAHAPLIKKAIKIIMVGFVASIAIYKLFLQADPAPSQDSIDQGITLPPPKPATPKDFANADIPLSGKIGGQIVPSSKNDAKNNISSKESNVSNNLSSKEVPLEPPDLPQLPDFTPPHSNENKQSPTGIKLPSINSIAKNSYKTPNTSNSQDSSDPDNPAPAQDPHSPQPLDLQNVNRNGIPIINSSDLSLEEKRRLTMFAINGNGPTDSVGAGNRGKQKSDIIIVDGSPLSLKKTNSNVQAEQVANLETTLIQGKMISATLETAINSQLPGNVRGIVNSDVCGEAGNKVLIPRGTRIYGGYTSAVNNGQSRITILWNRIIRPDGVSISINAQATDQFGRAGIEGDVDSRFGDNLVNTLLITFASLGTAVALNQLGGSSATGTVSTTNGGTSVTSSPLNTAATAAIQTWQNMANQLNANPLPTIISLPHGTKIKVMVAQDITLPVFHKVKMP